MEEINLTQPDSHIEKTRYTRFRRFLVASAIPLALLAAGCSGENKSSSNDTAEAERIAAEQKNIENEKADQKILLDCLIRVAQGPDFVDVLDNGDFMVRAGNSFYLLDEGARKKVLSMAKQNFPHSDLGLKFEQAEEEMQTISVTKIIMDFGKPVSPDQLTPDLKRAEGARQDLSSQLGGQDNLKPRQESPSPEIKTNPEVKDFL